MRYNTQNNIELDNAYKYLKKLCDKGANVEIIEKHKKRTLSQNAYLHVLINLFAIETGETDIAECKTNIKYHLKFYYFKGKVLHYKKTSLSNSKELTNFIIDFKRLADNMGIYLPEPGEIGNELLNYIEQHGF